MSTQDRVNFSYGLKIPGPVDYSSITFSSSFTTDVRDEETPEDAMERARKFVMNEVEKDYDSSRSEEEDGKVISAKKPKGKKG